MAGQPQLQANITSLALPNAFRPIEKEKNQPLEITAESALAVYINGEKEEFVLFEKNSETVKPIASLTKLITALTVLDIYQPNDIIHISSEAVGQEGEKGYLKADEFISVEDLLKIMLIESSNDAAFAFASHYFSEEKITPEAFKNLMNLETKHNIGLNPESTHFQNPSGLDPYNGIEEINHSTAKDLFEITKYILRERPEILEILSIPETTVAGRNLTTTNILLTEYPKIIGGKTGYTDRAGGCLALVLEAPGEDSYFINIILGSQERFEDMRKMIEWQNNSYLFR
jgi:D-alanyl-D-alanine carboxypeptidase